MKAQVLGEQEEEVEDLPQGYGQELSHTEVVDLSLVFFVSRKKIYQRKLVTMVLIRQVYTNIYICINMSKVKSKHY